MKKSLVLVIFFFGLLSCKPLFKIQTESLIDISPRKYKSFKFFNPKNMPESNFSFTDKNKKIIFDAVAGELKSRNFNSIQEADLIIKIQGGTSREIPNRSTNNYYDPYFGSTTYYNNWGNSPWMYDDISKKTTTLIIDIIDAKSKKLMWEGVGTGVLGNKSNQVENQIKTAIAGIFKKFPIPENSSK